VGRVNRDARAVELSRLLQIHLLETHLNAVRAGEPLEIVEQTGAGWGHDDAVASADPVIEWKFGRVM
jgi:hypothetical protein